MAPRRVDVAARAARRDEFIEAGRRLIQTRGYERFTVEDLLAEVGASKGAFYHYFDSKPALLEAVVERFVEEIVAAAAGVVADGTLPAAEKLRRYFATIASGKNAEREFLEQLLRVWYSDDNAVVREKTRRQTIRLVAPHVAAIIRQGIAEGAMTLADPDHMARVVLALILDAGDEAGELYLARRAGNVDLDAVRARLESYSTAIERVLGLRPGSLELVDEATLRTWLG
jgi:AcrR family transcriptional regulator